MFKVGKVAFNYLVNSGQRSNESMFEVYVRAQGRNYELWEMCSDLA